MEVAGQCAAQTGDEKQHEAAQGHRATPQAVGQRTAAQLPHRVAEEEHGDGQADTMLVHAEVACHGRHGRQIGVSGQRGEGDH